MKPHRWKILLLIAPLVACPLLLRASDPIRVACLGDSVTFGTRAPHPATESYPAQLQSLLGAGFVVKNLGIGGATFWHGGARNASQQLPAAKEFAPQVAIVMFGINDTRSDNGNWSHFPEAEVDAAKLLDALLAQTPQPRVLLCLPTSSAPELPGLTPERVTVLRDRIPRLDTVRAKLTALARRYAARGVELVDLDAATVNHPELHSADAVHFTAAGYHFIAETLRPRVLATAKLKPGEPAPR